MAAHNCRLRLSSTGFLMNQGQKITQVVFHAAVTEDRLAVFRDPGVFLLRRLGCGLRFKFWPDQGSVRNIRAP